MWSASAETWKLHHKRYPSALKGRASMPNKSALQGLDHFIWQELPPCLSRRSPPHITAVEYARIVRWKLQRGKFRPRLQGFANAATDADVVAASQAAFAALAQHDVPAALKPLIALKGCGPATASAILAAADSSLPFMSDELLVLVLGEEKKKYTVAAYLQLTNQVRAKAADLTKLSDGVVWTARDVERAVFAAGHYNPAIVDAAGEAAVTLGECASLPGPKKASKAEKPLNAERKKAARTQEHLHSEEKTAPIESADRPKPAETPASTYVAPRGNLAPDALPRGQRRTRSSASATQPVGENALSPRRSKRKRAA